jgi:hypothetical protein
MTATPAKVSTLEAKKIEYPTIGSKTWGRRFAKILLRVSVSIVVLLFVAQLMWRFSGSNQWKLVLEKNGIKVYSLKAPGSDLLQFKAIGRIHSTLPGVIAWITDTSACKIQGCTESYEISRAGEQLRYYYFQYDLAPFGKRDYAISALLYQIPDTKQVVVTIAAVPDKVPPRDGYVRVTNLNNKWRFTPLENGQIEVEIENNMELGGFMPTMLYNVKRPGAIYSMLTHLESWVAKDKYQSAKFSFIEDGSSAPPTKISQATTAQ